MFKKSLVSVLVLFLFNLFLCPAAFARSGGNKEREFVAKLKTQIENQGTGESSKIRLTLKDGTKIAGHISEINDSGIIVVTEKLGASVPISYAQIKKAKGNNWSANQAIWIGIVLSLIIIPLIIVQKQKNRT